MEETRLRMDIAAAQKILFCLRYGIGDVVMELPILEALREAAPAAHITVLAAPPAGELLEGDPRVDEIVGIDRWGLTHRWDRGTPKARAAIGEWLERSAFVLVLDVRHTVTAVKEVVRGRALQTLEGDEAAELAAVSRGAGGVAAIREAVRAGWGLEVPEDLLPRLYPRPAERRVAEAFLRHRGVEAGAPVVGISPVASHPLKLWSAERFAQVADSLVEQTGRPLLLFCGPQEEAGEKVVTNMVHSGCVIRVGPLHLRWVAALLARCALFVCNDTGLMHMAAAVGTPTVAIFGPTAPNIYRPPAPHAISVGGAGFECPHRNPLSLQHPGCWSSGRCLIAEESCVQRVGIEEVLAVARDLLRIRETATADQRGEPRKRAGARSG